MDYGHPPDIDKKRIEMLEKQLAECVKNNEQLRLALASERAQVDRLTREVQRKNTPPVTG